MIHRYMLKQHDEEHHNTELPFGCPNCEYRALSKMAIACHVTKYHKDHDKHICQVGSLPTPIAFLKLFHYMEILTKRRELQRGLKRG